MQKRPMGSAKGWQELNNKINRKHVLFAFFAGQLVLGLALLLYPMYTQPKIYGDFAGIAVLSVFGLLLVAISPTWLIFFRIFRASSQARDVVEQKKKDQESSGLGDLA